jgi:hypothetical protein
VRALVVQRPKQKQRGFPGRRRSEAGQRAASYRRSVGHGRRGARRLLRGAHPVGLSAGGGTKQNQRRFQSWVSSDRVDTRAKRDPVGPAAGNRAEPADKDASAGAAAAGKLNDAGVAAGAGGAAGPLP